MGSDGKHGKQASGEPVVGKRNLKELIKMEKAPEWIAAARTRLKTRMFSASTLASKDSKRRKVQEIMQSCNISFGVNGVNAEELLTVAAVLGEANIKSADQNLSELKLMQLEGGSSWPDVLERQLVMIKWPLEGTLDLRREQRRSTRKQSGLVLWVGSGMDAQMH